MALLQREPVELIVCQEVALEAVLILAGLHGSVGFQGLGDAMFCLLILHGTVHLVEATLVGCCEPATQASFSETASSAEGNPSAFLALLLVWAWHSQ